ncbi:uncharacterized protein LTR77_007986 [Saxophila tyrrhenica]|uniref:Heterokaryon incompatibility domain-containing protein n=1 Tax=Saxophila tyrrhenica TaxID=1690608 RepID=A0AAV9P1J8_9PEZI|nr:hypothetical protein LTR77_007986 [Saxophila tyrrhenica]
MAAASGSGADQRTPEEATEPPSRPSLSDEQRQVQCQKIYSPISDWETRLLFLLPGEGNDPLEANLRPAALTYHEEGVGVSGVKGKTSYEALSYTWGEPKFTHPITINGRDFSITENLHGALIHLRYLEKPRPVWVDALCINQLDLGEKAFQIAQMLRIYRRAKEVVVWLGDATPSTLVALNHLHKDRAYFTNCPKRELLETCAAFHDLLIRPWLRRTWVVQEVFAAAVINVHVGTHKISWSDFTWIGRQWEHFRTKQVLAQLTDFETWYGGAGLDILFDKPLDKPLDRLERIRHPTIGLDGRLGDKLLNLLEHANYATATDPRDAIYALQGILTSSPDYPSGDTLRYDAALCIDYTSTVAEVYTNVAVMILNARQDFTLLYELEDLAVGTGRSNDDLDLPSWVPNWRHYTRNTQRSAVAVGSPWRDYYLFYNTHQWKKQAGPVLRLNGLRLAEVQHVLKVKRSERTSATYSSWRRLAVCRFYPGLRWYLRSVYRTVYGVDSNYTTTENGLSTTATNVLVSTNRGFAEESVFFGDDRFLLWLRAELIWYVPKDTRPGDLIVSCCEGWPLVLRRRDQGGWVLVGYYKIRVNDSTDPLSVSLQRLAALFQEIYKWASQRDFEQLQVF